MSFLNNWNNAESEDRLQLVFENRNRDYGAYVIRREYDRNMALACLLGLGITVLLVCIPLWLKKEVIPKVIHHDPPVINTIDLPPRELPPKSEDKKPAGAQTPGPPDSGIPSINPNLSHVVAPPNLIPGGGRPGRMGLPGMAPGFGDRPGVDSTNSPFRNSGVVQIPEIHAQPKHGIPYFMAEMHDNIQIPADCMVDVDDLEMELLFLVDVKGRISNIQILKHSTCPGFDEAAVKVLSKTDNWIPGQSKGKFINSYKTLPFKLKVR